MHRAVRLLITGVAVAGIAGCASSGKETDPNGAGATTLFQQAVSTTDGSDSADDDSLLGEWVISTTADAEPPQATGTDVGFAVFNQVSGRLAVSIGQAECFVDSGFATVDDDTIRMTRIGDQTTVDCAVGPPLTEVESFIACIEQGCVIEETSSERLVLRSQEGSSTSFYLTHAELGF